MSPPTLSFSAAKNSQSDPVLVFLIKIKLLKIGAFINLGPVLVRESPAPISPIPRTPEVGVVICAMNYGSKSATNCHHKLCLKRLR